MPKDRHIFGKMKGCTADYLMVSGKLDIKKRPPVWLTFGGPIQESFKQWLAGELAKFKRQDKFCVIEIFSALGFRETAADGRDSGGAAYVWETNEYETRKDAFFSFEGQGMQRALLGTVIEIAKKSGCKYKISLMWEAQTLKGDSRFLPWLKEMVAFGYIMDTDIGVHSHVISHYKAADFVVYEGNSAMDLHLVNLGKPVYCLRRNVSPFSPRHKERNFEGSKEALIRLLQGQMLKELKANGCTAEPFARYLIQRILNNEIGENDFECSWFKKEMEKFILNISLELKKYRNKKLPRDFGIEFVYRRESKPDPTPTPAPKPIEDKEKYKKTEPLEIVEPVKEKNRMKFNPLKLIWTLIKRWWHMYDIYVVVAGIIIFRCPLLLGLAITTAWLISVRVIEVLKNRNQKPTKQRMESGEILPGDYYYENEPITVLEKPDHCPGE